LIYDYSEKVSEDIIAIGIGHWEIGHGDYFVGEIGIIDKDGKEITQAKYNRVERFSDGMAAVGVGDWVTDWYTVFEGKWGFIDETGNMVVMPS